MHTDTHTHSRPDPRHPAGLLDPEFDADPSDLDRTLDELRDLLNDR